MLLNITYLKIIDKLYSPNSLPIKFVFLYFRPAFYYRQIKIKWNQFCIMENSKRKTKRNCLKDFKSCLRSCRLFNDATGQLPQFLQQNLLDDARTVKIFKNDGHAFLKIFYFQFLKLCFQAEDVDYNTKINKFIECMENNLHLLSMDLKGSQSQLSPEGIKNILFQFLQILSECKQPVEITLAQFPVAGSIMTTFLAKYLEAFHDYASESFNTNSTIQILCKDFEVDIVQYDDCIQFTDSQVYLYKENDQQIYLVYIDQSKACRNTKVSSSENDKINSNKSLERDNYEVIKFEVPDVVFTNDQSMIRVDLDGLDKKQMLKTNFVSTVCDSNSGTIKAQSQAKTNRLNSFLGSSQQQKQNRPKGYFDITKQFTDTFILDTIVSEPFRTKIKEIKTKARNDRKSTRPFFL